MDKKFKRTLVTCALPYANGPVHIGHLAGVYVPADIYVRYLRMRGEDVLYVCGSDEHLSLKKLAKISGHKKIEMIPVAKIEVLTGYIRGGCSPIKMKKTFPTFISDKAKDLPYIIISAGKRGAQIKIAPENLQKAIRYQFADISDVEEVEN